MVFSDKRLRLTVSTLALTLSALLAHAQEAAEPEQIVVTGTRLSTGFNAPTPVTVLGAQELQKVAPDSIMDAVSQLPALSGSQPTTNSGAVSAGGGVNGEALLNLRGLGANRTLVLLDGNRLAPSNTLGTVDVNTIPQALIGHVDIVTGGASATYGSDAVAGVVNFVLNTHFTGFKGSIDGGETTYGDGKNGHISAAYGTELLGNRLHVIGSADYFMADGIGLPPQGDRDWYNKPYGAYPNLAATNPPTPTTTTTIVVPDVRFVNASYGGLITSVKGCVAGAAGNACRALAGQQFLAGGVLGPFNTGTHAGSTFTSGGDGPVANNGLSAAQHRLGLFARAEYDLDDAMHVFVEGSYVSSHSFQYGAYPFENGSKFQFTIQNNNAYLPAPVAAILAANPGSTFTLGRYSNDLIPIINNDLDRTLRAATGIVGRVGSHWDYDASVTYTRTAQYFDQTDTINRNLYAAADAVVNPATGKIVCRSNYFNSAGVFAPGGTGLDQGCVPINLFGVGAVSQVTPAAIPYVERYDQGDSVFHQTTFNANLRGDLGDLNLGAGPISVALGITYRRDDVNRMVDPISATYTSCAGLRGCPSALDGLYGGYQSYNPGPLKGSVSATEGFTEFGVPLLQNKPFVQSLNLDVAGRMTDYSNSGVVYSDKIGLDWRVDDSLRFRATHSQDIRAPSLTDLYSAGTSATNSAVVPASASLVAGGTSLPASSISLGNPNLLPETAHTSTVGAIYSPSWLDGFQGSVDYYKIGIGGAIGTVGQQNIIDGCYQGNQVYCALITYTGTAGNNLAITDTRQIITGGGTSVTVKNPSLNIARQTKSGVDLEAAYQVPLWDGTLTARALANIEISAYNSINTANSQKIVGTNGGNDPYWTANLSLNYENESYSVFLQERLISAGYANPNLLEGYSINQNTVPLIGYTTVTLAYKFDAYYDSHNELFFTVTNLFNQDPPVTVTGSSSFENPTNYGLYDVLGRRFTLGWRLRM